MWKKPSRTKDRLDIRFAVNTFSPYIINTELLPILDRYGRILDIASNATDNIDVNELTGRSKSIDAIGTYSQSKLALSISSYHFAFDLALPTQMVITVHPGSLLATKMLTEDLGVAGKDIDSATTIMAELAVSTDIPINNGGFYDNDIQSFTTPHPDVINTRVRKDVLEAIEETITRILGERE